MATMAAMMQDTAGVMGYLEAVLNSFLHHQEVNLYLTPFLFVKPGSFAPRVYPSSRRTQQPAPEGRNISSPRRQPWDQVFF